MFWSEYTFWDQIQILSQIKYKYVAFLDVSTNTLQFLIQLQFKYIFYSISKYEK